MVPEDDSAVDGVEQYYTPREVAKLFKISRDTVITWIRINKLDAIKVANAWRIPHSAVVRIATGEFGGGRPVPPRVRRTVSVEEAERQLAEAWPDGIPNGIPDPPEEGYAPGPSPHMPSDDAEPAWMSAPVPVDEDEHPPIAQPLPRP